MAMPRDFKAELSGHFVLELFDTLIFEFDDGSTGHADQMIVVLSRNIRLVTREVPFTKTMLCRQAHTPS